ncbi:MAG: hypothetical protein H6718_18290 [Polyangiaceae bacterium]|nr:hypothetical protein [Polyangiaceae bacterium]MCB9605847.1 hypothetical protein [Polyangiaceae bacterium]
MSSFRRGPCGYCRQAILPLRTGAILLLLGFLGACGDVTDGSVASTSRETPESWEAHLERSDLGLQATELPGGGRAVDLRGGYQHAQVVTLQSGAPELVCANRVPAVVAVLNHTETEVGQ